jgi:hypothetical protein
MNKEQKNYYYPILKELEDKFDDKLADEAIIKLAKIHKKELPITALTEEDIEQLVVCSNY